MKFKKISRSKLVYYIIIAAIIVALNFVGEYTIGKPVDGKLEVHFINVDQADSILIRTEEKNMLIDGATDHESDTVVSYLESLGIEKLDIIVATHPHEDHIGGLDEVIYMFGAETIYMPDVSADTDTYLEFLEAAGDSNVIFPESGDVFSLEDAEFTVIAPNDIKYSDMNNYSICLRMTYGQNSFLFMGDAETKSEREIMNKGYSLKSDVLKVAHHGSKSASSPEFINRVKPSISVVSVGAFNKYDLPDEEVIDRVSECSRVYRTDYNGNIVITSDGNNMEVRCDNN